MGKFPKSFPPDFEKNILPKEARKEDIKVFRIMKSGKINKEGFLSTYEETIKKIRPENKNDNKKDPSYYSTSCDLTLEKAKYVLEMIMRHCPPKPIIAEGVTKGECGVCQRTYDRTGKEKDKNHVDWWLYEDAQPQKYFKEVKQ